VNTGETVVAALDPVCRPSLFHDHHQAPPQPGGQRVGGLDYSYMFCKGVSTDRVLDPHK
jgi:hypothetical protein